MGVSLNTSGVEICTALNYNVITHRYVDTQSEDVAGMCCVHSLELQLKFTQTASASWLQHILPTSRFTSAYSLATATPHLNAGVSLQCISLFYWSIPSTIYTSCVIEIIKQLNTYVRLIKKNMYMVIRNNLPFINELVARLKLFSISFT